MVTISFVSSLVGVGILILVGIVLVFRYARGVLYSKKRSLSSVFNVQEETIRADSYEARNTIRSHSIPVENNIGA